MKTGRADMRRLPAVVLVCLLLVTVIGCWSAGTPALSASELQALMERERQAEEMFQQALAAGADPKRQEDLYRQAIGLVPDMGKAHNNLGLLLLGQERYEEAMPELREAVKALPDSASSWCSSARESVDGERLAHAVIAACSTRQTHPGVGSLALARHL